MTNIITEVSLGPDNDKIVHPILEALEEIHSCVLATSCDLCVATLDRFTEQARLSLAHRVMGTKHGAYSDLMAVIKMAKVVVMFS